MSSTPFPPTINERFILNWGFQFIAYTLDTALWGIAMALVLQYFRNFPRDPFSMRIVVGILGIVTTIHTIFSAILNYRIFVTNYGNLPAEDVISFEANVMLCSVFVVAFTAQMFYATRIWILTKKSWRYVTPVVLMALLQFSSGIAQTISVAKVHLFSKLQENTRATSSLQSASALACDLMITGILFSVLRRAHTGAERTDSALDKMMIYALNRGAMTSLFALLQLIFFVAMPETFVFMMFILPSCHLYVISVCSMLISRESIRAELYRATGRPFGMTTLDSSHRPHDGNNNNIDSIHVS
ncbi:hypothetical protein B0H15DRAFT_300720 [Mycena belliarum]|uniref:DUF6534 domain-containing protein n=1 Tax=Mycena belliarum TaxID=1033014 RepID=A0AAD6XU83_9AGAR|nr:hypothetical protein B0H15DRAFT_300720 [Mycena belliae]